LVGTSATTEFVNTGLAAGITYYYVVTAVNNGGESSQSNEVYATTRPSSPTNVTAVANSANSISIYWAAVSGAIGYHIYHSTSTADYTWVGHSASTSYIDDNLSTGTRYYYKVSAYNSGGESPQSTSTVYATTE